MHERLDRVLAPGAERPGPEPTAKPFDAGKPDPLDLAGVAVQHLDAAGAQDLLDLVLLTGLKIVVAEHTDNWHAHAGQLPGQDLSLLNGAIVTQVAAEQQHVGLLSDSGK